MQIALFVVGETCYFNGLFDKSTGTSELGEGFDGEERGVSGLGELLTFGRRGGGHGERRF